MKFPSKKGKKGETSRPRHGIILRYATGRRERRSPPPHDKGSIYIMTLADIISLLGGLAFFLFGMTLLGDGLKRVAGSKLETVLGRLTSTTLRGVLLGTAVTAVIQSSSATTVMVVGFVNSGIMKLTNAIGIIMGANVGTTATGWVLTLADVEGSGGFTSATVFALIAFIGIVLCFMSKKPTLKNVGSILLAFSVLMSGMQAMSASMDPLKEDPAFLGLISAVSHPALAMLVGLVVTAIIQSSSASIGILQALSVTGIISYEVAIPMILGMCIGGCVPVLLSAIGANVNGKRAAMVYLYFNVAGSVILMIPFYLYHMLAGFDFMALPATSVGIAVANTVYKVLATLVLLPFARQLEALTVATIREKAAGEEDDAPEENYLDERFLAYPPLAVEQGTRTLIQMAAAAQKNLNKSLELLRTFDQTKYDKIMSREEKVDRYEDRLGNYLVKLNTRELSEAETLQTSKLLHSITNLERISDHAVNLASLALEMHSKGISFSEQAIAELQVCAAAVREIVDLACTSVCRDDFESARHVEPLEQTIDALTGELKSRHITRLQAGQCTLELGFIFNDCVNNFERVADHCSNLAVSVIELKHTSMESHDYLRTLKKSTGRGYHHLLGEYEEKYYAQLKRMEQKQQKQEIKE